MNEIKEILTAVLNDGITDDRLEEIRLTHDILGQMLDSAQSRYGLSAEVAVKARKHLESQQGKS
jgi:hypothetical protein